MRYALIALLVGCSFEPGVLPGTGPNDDAGRDDATDAPLTDINDPDVAVPPLRQKLITISQLVVGTHTDFPLWITLTDADIAARARSDGTDIHFVANGVPLDYEIQQWTQTDGQLDAWVRVPSFAAGTQLAIRYGDLAMAHAPNAPAAFSGYAAVWHLEDALSTTNVVDTRNLANGTAVNLQTTDSVDAQLGRGIDFDDGTDRVTFVNAFTGAGAHTISVWINQAATTSNDAIIAFGTAAAQQARWFHSRFNTATVAVGFYNNDYGNPAHDIIGDGWVLLHWVFEGANRMSRLYRDGMLVAGPFQHDPGINTQGTGGVIGNAPAGFGTNMGSNAVLDELRIIAVARDATWIAAEALNQRTPTDCYSISAEQIP